MIDPSAGVVLDVAVPRAGGRSIRTLIGSIGDLGFLVKHLSSDTGQGTWRLFSDERNLANHLRAMAIAEAEVQRVLRALGGEGRVVLPIGEDPPGTPQPEPRCSNRPATGVSSETGPR